nr:CAP domain-containing protein [Kineosporia babensis]
MSAAATAQSKKKIAKQKKLRKKVIQFTNATRKENGCKPLKKSKALMRAAQKHSRVQAKNQKQGHQFPGEDDLGTRIAKAGFKNAGGVSENAAGAAGGGWFVNARHVMYGGTATKNGTGFTSIGWMESKGHKANILNCSSTHIGVGAYIDGKGAIWWTQNFAAKR